MTNHQQPPVVIVGAGPVGLAAALCAAQSGAQSVIVLEKRSKHDLSSPPASTQELPPSFKDVFSRSNVFQVTHWTLEQLEGLGVARSDAELELCNVKELLMCDAYAFPKGKGPGSLRDPAVSVQMPGLFDKQTLQDHIANVEGGVRNVSAQRVADDNIPFEMTTVSIRSLQHALYAAIERQYPTIIDVQFGVSDVSVAKDGSVSWTVPNQHKPHTIKPAVTILACGSRSDIVDSLFHPPVIHSPTQHFIYYPLPPTSIPTVGPNIYFNRHFDPSSQTFIKQAMIGHTSSPPVISVQLPSPTTAEQTRSPYSEEVDGAISRFHTAFPNLAGTPLKPDTTHPVHFTVTETSRQSNIIGQTVVIGDAARTGHFNAALGVTLSLVCDINAVGRLVKGVMKIVGGGEDGVGDRWFDSLEGKKVCARFDEEVRETGRVFREKDLMWFYERL
ncbi:hypothetical protein HDV00_012271 [Rhizophlyctis rosea]|nr:hypothetical protein HDV00_012271 [Rhizophlyctis rosea]